MHHLVRRCPVCAWLFMCGVPLLLPSTSTPGQPLPPAATATADFMLKPAAFHQWLHTPRETHFSGVVQQTGPSAA